MRERECFDTLCNTADGVFIVDANKHIIRWNKGAERILRFTENEVLHHDCFRVIAGRIQPDKVFCGPNCRIYNGIRNGTVHKNFDLLTQTSDGEPLWLNVSILAPCDGDEPFIVHILRDVTREKKTSLALAQFLAELENPNPVSKDSSTEKHVIKSIAAARFPSLDKPPVALSDRETEVLTLLAEGLSTKSLAQRLNISHFTARNHIQNILVKLDLHSKAQAVSYAFKKGIL
jgi:PAS domain S-box-containing protein